MAESFAIEMDGKWPLESGTWRLDDSKASFTLELTSANRPVSVLAAADVGVAMEASLNSNIQQHPPEFTFDVASGARLHRMSTSSEQRSWMPPFGNNMPTSRGRRAVRGLRQTDHSVQLAALETRSAVANPDAERALPPAGHYEFLNLMAHTRAHVLLALDPSKGVLQGWLPKSARWESLEHASGNGSLAETRILPADWRCEVTTTEQCSRIFLSTDEGLGCVVPDLLALQFEVNYTGGGPAIGSPLYFADLIWAPVRTAAGRFAFVSMNGQGEIGETADISGILPSGVDIGQVHAPVGDARCAVWPTDVGQLILRSKASGALEVLFRKWPDRVRPVYNFGSPYLAKNGALWQLGFHGGRDQYVYVLLGADSEEMHNSQPRMSSGAFNFRFKTKELLEPWSEPEQGDDSGTDEVVVPILECTGAARVYGVLLKSTQGLEALLGLKERLRAQLIVDDANQQMRFHSFTVPEPWRLRLFLHDGCLWAYHPSLPRLSGWKLHS